MKKENMKKIAIVGYKGRMGTCIFNALKLRFCVVGIGRKDKLGNQDFNLVIDFASHESSVISAEYCLSKKIPLIIGATGHTDDELQRINEISKQIKIIKRANFSSGFEIIKQCLTILKTISPQKIVIVEKHHKNKKDYPSGTALELKQELQNIFAQPVEIQSIREGEEMGEHCIEFYTKDEIISFKHNILSREAFVQGVVGCVENLLA